jgi:hypothetical protein
MFYSDKFHAGILLNCSKGVAMGSNIIKSSLAWLVLMVLTLLAVAFSQLGLDHNFLLKAVLVITILKGLLVAHTFMGLDKAPRFWQGMMASYLLLVPFGIFAIYFIAS